MSRPVAPSAGGAHAPWLSALCRTLRLAWVVVRVVQDFFRSTGTSGYRIQGSLISSPAERGRESHGTVKVRQTRGESGARGASPAQGGHEFRGALRILRNVVESPAERYCQTLPRLRPPQLCVVQDFFCSTGTSGCRIQGSVIRSPAERGGSPAERGESCRTWGESCRTSGG